jgi:5-methylcytosine-specific restriction protein A
VHTGSRSAAAKEWHKLYDTRWWQDYRRVFLMEHPTCCDPFNEHGPLVPTWTADHIVPHRGDWNLFTDPSNHRPVCRHCNSRLARTEQRI